MKGFLVTIAGLAGVLVVIFGLQYLGLMNYEFFAPKRQNIERKVFEQTKSYRDGTVRDIQNLAMEYYRATSPEHKAILADTIMHRTADFDADLLPYDLQVQLRKIKGEQL